MLLRVLIVLIIGLQKWGFTETQRKVTFSVEAGGFLDEIEKRYFSASLYPSLNGSQLGFLRGRLTYQFHKRFSYESGLGAAVPFRSSNDGDAKSWPLQLDQNLGFKVKDWLSFHAGAGIYSLFIFGSGADVVLNNGNSTSTYYAPSTPKLTLNFSTNFGLRIFFTRWLSFNTDIYCLNLLSASQRSFNLTSTLAVVL